MTTLKDISLEVSLSIQAVSLVLNGKANGQISEENCAKILAAAKKLDYRPNRNARRMRSRHTENLSILIDDIGQPYGNFPDFRSDVNLESLYGILDCAALYGYDLKLLPLKTRSPEDTSLFDQRIGPPYSDGVIIHGLHYRSDVFDLIRGRGIPYALISTLSSDTPSPRTTVNPVPAMRQAVTTLIRQGHRRIAWCSHCDPRTSFLPIRFKGYQEEMTSAGLYDESLVLTAENELDIRRLAMDTIQRRQVTAIVCSNDEIAYRWILECRYGNLRIPQDMAVIGFDGSYKYDFISTIDLRLYDCGFKTTENLIHAIQTGQSPQDIVIESQFLQRNTN